MKNDLNKLPNLIETLENHKIVYIFGTGISSALTGAPYSWYRWIVDGINSLHDVSYSEKLQKRLESDDSTDNMISVVSDLMMFAKSEGSYDAWMQKAFETNPVTNLELASTLSKMLMTQDVLATTNYDLLLEQATNLGTTSYDNPDVIFPMLEKNLSTHVLHLHGLYDSKRKIDNIIADEAQYVAIYNDEGAQFIQNLLGTRTLIFVGCGQTTEDINIARFIRFAKEHLKLDIPYYFLHQSGATLPEMPDNIWTIEYGTDYADLPLFLEDMVQHRIKHFFQKHPLIGRTIYNKEHLNSSGILSYHFAQEQIDFEGRTKELADLKTFLEDERPCIWWAITGQAGSGKSRLAFELMNRNKVKWFSFFLNDAGSVNDARKVVPFCNTMIVIDYVKGREKEIAIIVQQLIEKFQQSDYKLRILFLERENSTVSGSWYDSLEQSFGKYDRERFNQIEYRRQEEESALELSGMRNSSHSFIYLEDLEANAVVSFIGSVCRKQGLPDDSARDIKLKEDYGRKFEQLRYRPLFIQIYVEAWIENDCKHPRYDGFESLLEKVLQKEQERWISCVDGDRECCNALIRILVRASAGNGLKIGNLPERYQNDWNKLNNYIKNHSYPGEQRKHSLQIFLADICQSIDKNDQVILPLYPDIIKEYMFAYYTDKSDIAIVSQELWTNAGGEFSRFLYRCLTDFRDNDTFIQCIENSPDSMTNVNVMAARLAFLNRKVIQPKDDVEKLIDRIEKEYAYWHSVPITADTDRSIAITKFGGLSLVAMQYGAWMAIDKMMECIREALAIPGDEALNMLKSLALSERINQLSKSGYKKEANELRSELLKISSSFKDNELMTLNVIQGLNAEMMTYLFQDDFYQAYEVLKRIESKCDTSQTEQIKMYAHSCFNMTQFGMMMKKPRYIQRALDKLQVLYDNYGENVAVKAFYIKGKMQEIQERYFREKSSNEQKETIKQEVECIISEMDDSIMCNELAETWAMTHLFLINFIDKPKPLEEMLIKTEILLKEFPDADALAQTYIGILRKLHKECYNTKVTKTEVEKAFAYLQRYPDSESIREAFFHMLEDSEERNNVRKYMTKQVLSETINFGCLNPAENGQVDDLSYLLDELGYIHDIENGGLQEPYKRSTPKVGRNDPCPCGSGKKYKKCCGR